MRVNKFEPKLLVNKARVAAMRWDLVEWGIVLDLDVATSEADGAPMRRGWLIFEAISDITWSLNDARLPIGFWTDGLTSEPCGRDTREYFLRAQLPQVQQDEGFSFAGPQLVVIKARNAVGLISTAHAGPNEFGFLSFNARNALASDKQFLASYISNR